MNIVPVSKPVSQPSEFVALFSSPHTRNAYWQDICDFYLFLKEHGRVINHPSEHTALDFAAFRESMEKAGSSAKTIARKLSTIKSLMNWYVHQGDLTSNPMTFVKLPKADVKDPTQVLTDKEVISILKAVEVKDFSTNLHKLTLSFLFNFGLRRSELCQIKMKDVFKSGDYTVLRVLGKGGKVRELPFNVIAINDLQVYLNNYQNFSGKIIEADDYLFQSEANKKNEKPLNSNTIFKILKKYATLAGITKRISPHSCRATAITKALEEGAIITEVADMAGHSSINTTQIYWKRRRALSSSPIHKLNYGVE